MLQASPEASRENRLGETGGMRRKKDVRPAWTFVAPPNWPTPPEGWTPPAGWQPPPEWPAAPPGWQFWSQGDAAPRETGRPASTDVSTLEKEPRIDVISQKLPMSHSARASGNRYVAVAQWGSATYRAFGVTRSGTEKRAARQLRKLLASTRSRTL